MDKPFVSIIIPAKNAKDTLKKCIDSLLALSYPCYEIIFVNDGSSDLTAEILSGYNKIKILTTQGIGPSRARNMALSQARGDFMAFTDADCVVDENWLSELLNGFINEKIAAVGGLQRQPDDDAKFAKTVHEFLSIFGFVADYMKSGSKIREVLHNASCNVMYRKAILCEVDGFCPDLWPGEDVELDYRIKKRGYIFMFTPLAVVYHYRTKNLKSFNKMMFRYGQAQGWLVKKYGFFRLIQFMPVVILFLFLLLVCDIFLGLSFMLLGVTAIFIKLLIQSRKPLYMLYLFLQNTCIWNMGFLTGLFKRKIP